MNCNLCKKELDNPLDPKSMDCGGDCLACVEEIEKDTLENSDPDGMFDPIVKRETQEIIKLRESLKLDRCKIKPYAHQVIGIEQLIKNVFFALFDEMGAGKTLQVIVAGQILYELGIINRVIVIAPASVRPVWYDPDFGELAKHLFLPSRITEFHAKVRGWFNTEETDKSKLLHWMITNYEFIRSAPRLKQLLPAATNKTLLILDESSSVKWWKTKQTKACLELREECGRVVILNGTPVANHPGDMYSQGAILSKKILDCKNWFQFKARYGVLGGWQQKQIIDWRNVDDIQRRFAPYVLRRLKKDCIDLPSKLPPVVYPIALSEPTWSKYKAMRDDMVAWLTENSASSVQQAIVKIMRLAQITSGFLGGVEEFELDDSALLEDYEGITQDRFKKTTREVEEIGREKLDFFFQWLDDRLAEDENFKVICWSRFVPEIARNIREAKLRYTGVPIGVVAGGYKKTDREFALRLLDPRTAPKGPAFIFGNPQSGGLGLNMTAARHMFRMSSDYSHYKRAQSDDRIHRPGQLFHTWYGDLVATGPQGQKTIDHITLKSLMKKDNLAEMTTSAWVSELLKE